MADVKAGDRVTIKDYPGEVGTVTGVTGKVAGVQWDNGDFGIPEVIRLVKVAKSAKR